MKGFEFVQVDTWFFRDASPFPAGSAAQNDVGGLFPPFPPTVSGALRAAYARANGWSGEMGKWGPDLDRKLGTGIADPGELGIVGPFVLLDRQPLFEVPASLYKLEGDGNTLLLACPGTPIECDLGKSVRLPHVDAGRPGRLIGVSGCMMNAQGLAAVLRGEAPEPSALVEVDDLWATEARIGLELDFESRTARQGMLFGTRHIRLRRNVSLGVLQTNLPDGLDSPSGQLCTLGGESRLAELADWEWDPKVLRAGLESASERISLVALTPLCISPEAVKGQRDIDGLEGVRVVSACTSGWVRVGGWDSVNSVPVDLRSCLSPGSVLFCEVSRPEIVQQGLGRRDGIPQIGDLQAHGFGGVAIGSW